MHALDAEARLYNDLLRRPEGDDLEENVDFLSTLNPDSLELRTAKVEPSVQGAPAGTRYQFERIGYFCVDKDSTAGKMVFNRTVGLRDTWAKIEKKSS